MFKSHLLQVLKPPHSANSCKRDRRPGVGPIGVTKRLALYVQGILIGDESTKLL